MMEYEYQTTFKIQIRIHFAFHTQLYEFSHVWQGLWYTYSNS